MTTHIRMRNAHCKILQTHAADTRCISMPVWIAWDVCHSQHPFHRLVARRFMKRSVLVRHSFRLWHRPFKRERRHGLPSTLDSMLRLRIFNDFHLFTSSRLCFFCCLAYLPLNFREIWPEGQEFWCRKSWSLLGNCVTGAVWCWGQKKRLNKLTDSKLAEVWMLSGWHVFGWFLLLRKSGRFRFTLFSQLRRSLRTWTKHAKLHDLACPMFQDCNIYGYVAGTHVKVPD